MWQYNGLLSRGQILRSMEDFADKVLPEFGGLGGLGVKRHGQGMLDVTPVSWGSCDTKTDC